MIVESNLDINPNDLEEIKLYNVIIEKILKETRVNKELLYNQKEKALEIQNRLFKMKYKDRTKYNR